MPKQKITVEFTSTGAPQLIKQVHNLANAKNKLNKTQEEATRNANANEKVRHRITRGMHDQKGALDQLQTGFSLLRNRLLVFGFAYNLLLKPLANVTKAAVDQSSKFESLRARLSQLYGGVIQGAQAFDQFNTAAAKTPFTVEDIVTAGAQLKAFGADARELLTEITDLASYMGTTATEAANSLGRAWAGGAGAADILREKGVLNLVKSFKGIDDLSKLTLPEFREALMGAMRDPALAIAGATAVMADTYQGALSNMQDATQRMQAAMGNLLMPTAKSTMLAITDVANSVENFFLQWNESEMETAVRQMKELGVAAKDLKEFEMILQQEKLIEQMEMVEFNFNEAVLNISNNSQQFSLNMIEMLDTIVENAMGISAKKTHELITWTEDNLGVTWESLEASFRPGFGAAQGIEAAFDLSKLEDTEELMKRLKVAWAKINVQMRDAYRNSQGLQDPEGWTAVYEGTKRQSEFLAEMIKVTQQSIRVNQQHKDSMKYLAEQGKGEGKEPTFLPKEIANLKKLLDMYNSSNEARLKTLSSYRKLLVAKKEDIIKTKENGIGLEEFTVILKMVNEEIKKLSETKDPFKAILISGPDLMKTLHKQNDEYIHMQDLLESLEANPSWKEILDNINVHSDAYNKQRGIIDGIHQSIKGQFNNLTQGRKRSIEELIKEAKALQGNSEALEELQLSALDVELVILKLTEDLDDLNKGIAGEFLSDFDKFVQGIRDASAAEENLAKWIQDVKDGVVKLTDVEMEYFNAKHNTLEGEAAWLDAMEKNIESIQNEEKWLENLAATYREKYPEIADLIEEHVIGKEEELLTYKDFKANLEKTLAVQENQKNLEQDLLDNYAKLSPALKEYVDDNIKVLSAVEKLTKKTDDHIDAMEEQDEMVKIAEASYFALEEEGRKVLVTLNLLSDAFMETHGIDGHASAIETLLQTYRKGTEEFKKLTFTQNITEAEAFLVTQKDLLKTYAKGSTEYEAQVIRIQELEKGLAALTNANKDFLNAGTLTDKLQKKFDSTIKNSKKSQISFTLAFIDHLEKIRDGEVVVEGYSVNMLELNGMIKDAEKNLDELNGAPQTWIERVKEAKTALEEKRTEQALEKQIIEEIIELDEQLARDMGLLPQTYEEWEQALEDTNAELEKEVGWKEDLIRLNPVLAGKLGWLDDTYHDLLKTMREKRQADDDEIERQKDIHRELRKTSDGLIELKGLIEGGYLKSWKELMGQQDSTYKKMKDSLREYVITQNEENEAINNLIDGYTRVNGVLYPNKKLMEDSGMIAKDLTQAEIDLARAQEEVNSRAEELRHTRLDEISEMIEVIGSLKESNPLYEYQAELLSELFQERTSINDAQEEENKLLAESIALREKQMSLGIADIDFYQSQGLEKPDLTDDSGKLREEADKAMFGYRGERRAKELKALKDFYDMKKLLLEDATAKEIEIIETDMKEAIDKAEEVMGSGQMMDFADGVIEVYGMFSGVMSDMVSDLSENVERSLDHQMRTLKASNRYQKANDADRLKMEEQLLEDMRDQRLKAFRAEKAMRLSQAAMSTASGIMDAVDDYGMPAAWPWIAIISSLGALQAGTILSQSMPQYHSGGLIGGKSHEKGGTIIEAEAGEFIMRREAVAAMGVENMERINNLATDIAGAKYTFMMGNLGTKRAVIQGLNEGRYERGGLVTSMHNNNNTLRGEGVNVVVNFEGNILSEDFIVDEAIPLIRDAIRRGDNILD